MRWGSSQDEEKIGQKIGRFPGPMAQTSGKRAELHKSFICRTSFWNCNPFAASFKFDECIHSLSYDKRVLEEGAEKILHDPKKYPNCSLTP